MAAILPLCSVLRSVFFHYSTNNTGRHPAKALVHGFAAAKPGAIACMPNTRSVPAGGRVQALPAGLGRKSARWLHFFTIIYEGAYNFAALVI